MDLSCALGAYYFPTGLSYISFPLADRTVDSKGVVKLLHRLNVHRGPGQDRLIARVLKECSVKISAIDIGTHLH